MSDLIWFLIIGAIAGWLGSLLFKGSGSGLIVNIVLGILGGIVGGWIFRMLGIESFRYGGFVAAVVGAIILCWIASMFNRRA